MKCQHGQCGRDAVAAVRINVPRAGVERDEDPATAVFGLVLCEEHHEGIKPSDFLGLPGGKMEAIFDIAARAKFGPDAKLDFARAHLGMCRFESSEWRVLQRNKSR